ncbi:MAG: acetyl-CoA carboxylase carboxyltransferase subunit alpha [Alphaproteobacteria bacterium]|nr:MAG: acetyl-CoA carboxylase carboxyltransferase subunit alpha [Alphaproteobacteria bacterium]
MASFLDFEKPLSELHAKAEELKRLPDDGSRNLAEEMARIDRKTQRVLRAVYTNLSPWQKVQVARHPDRPRFKDYVKGLIADFTPLAGDRNFAEDRAIMGGLGRFKGQAVVVMGQERGSDTQSRLAHNFGMPKPEGYRKAIRLMQMADQFGLPVITLVDTPGAYPGIDAEERGQAEAIARCIEMGLTIKVPIISTVTGEGGSGGAIAIATGNHIMMYENAVYSVISPEGCASILWRSAAQAREAAEALKMTAQDLLALGVIDEIVAEPLGAAHRAPAEAIGNLSAAIDRAMRYLGQQNGDQLLKSRREKFLAMGRRIPGLAK